MPEQSYSKHTRRVPLFLASVLILLLSFIGACVILYHSFHRPEQFHVALIIALVCVGTIIGVAQARLSTLKVQDRAIRAEENLRHFGLTGKFLDKRLTIPQITAVRFASDDQFPELAREAAEKSLKPDDIKRAVKNWKADFHRA